MHILRWLMKHPLILAWVLALTAILLNFGLGGTANNGYKIAAGHKPAAAEQQAAAATAAPAQATAPAVTAEVAPAAVPAQVAAPAVTAEAAPQAAAPAVTAPAQPQAVAGEVAGASSEADLLRAAREAFWSNELDNAVGFYTSLLKQAPDSVEYKGELANVYWKQGNAQQAATLFADIAPQVAAQGRTTEALNMKLYVDMVDPELAKKIDAGMNK
ncbi:MAG: tetratricopeptide repeat protein [Thiothrix sp.]|uniref:tetratricopeptide repeat protein n=1 Tax=Thiothrix sp. TaxID=1032 RepID=UPI00262E0772|nr:tetratricopeptide repeat protein [Thiothrix sp.]MDD5393311.1 tetratricopeptide repeat protein [Thiothrix sp.]